MSNSRGGWTLYLLINFPLIIFVKIGITGKSASARAKGLDKSVPGLPIPIFFCIVPGAYHIEQWLHRNLSGLSVRYYSKDGSSEWFWIIAAPFALAAMGLIWGIEIGALYAVYWLLKNS